MYMNQVRLLVTDYAKSFAFYKTVLGLDLAFGDKTSGYAEFLTGDDTSALAIMNREFLADILEGESAESSDSFNLTFTVASVDETYKSLKAKGVDFITEPTTREEMNGRIAHFRDPDGILIELYEMLGDAGS